MQNTHRKTERLCRKQIAFDLSESRLRESYSRSEKSSDLRYYKKAWTDIARFMEAINFEHRQYSVYDSRTEMMEMEIYTMVWAMLSVMPWMKECLEAMDVTDIGENHDLMPVVKAMEPDKNFELAKAT